MKYIIERIKDTPTRIMEESAKEGADEKVVQFVEGLSNDLLEARWFLMGSGEAHELFANEIRIRCGEAISALKRIRLSRESNKGGHMSCRSLHRTIETACHTTETQISRFAGDIVVGWKVNRG